MTRISSNYIVDDFKPEKFYQLGHSFYGCMNPKCRFTYTESELNSKEIVDYVKNHTYAYHSHPVIVYEFEFQKLDTTSLGNMKNISGWTPHFNLEENGFDHLADIDLFDLYGVKKTVGASIRSNFEQDPDKLKAKLQSLNLGNTPVIIYRTYRGGFAVWDNVDVFGIGKYHLEKDAIREKITKYWLERQKIEDQEIAKRLAENKKNGTEPVDWETAKARLDKFLKEKKPKNFLFDPASDTGIVFDSKGD